MSGPTQTETLVYRDLEKFHRITGYYDGQEIMPLEQAEAHIQSHLETRLRSGSEYIRRLSYRLNMSEVICDGRSVYQAEKPELSLVYSLFSEGIQSLILLRDLSAQDIKEWLELVRRTIEEFEAGGMKDLASVLWRSPSRNIRTRIYNSLSELEAQANQIKAKKVKSEEKREEKSSASAPEIQKPKWHERDQEWDTPEATSVVREKEAQAPLASEKVRKARESLRAVELNFELPAELRLSSDEILSLTQELSFFDQNHVDVNLMTWQLSALKQHELLAPEVKTQIREFLSRLTEGVISRFQPSLIFLILNEISQLPRELQDIRADILGRITKTLRHPANEKRLLSSLLDPERAKVTKRLFPYLDSKQFPAIIDFFLKFDDRDGLVEFLKIVLEGKPETVPLLFSWGEQRLTAILPLFRRLQWPEKYDFLKKCLKSSSKALSKQAAFYLYAIPFDTEEALKTYSGLNDEAKEIWVKALLDNPPKDSWKPIIRAVFSTGKWMEASHKTMASRLMMAWVSVALKYYQVQSFALFREFIVSRRWHFFPKYPEIRELCLLELIRDRSLRGKPEFLELMQRELRCVFQDKGLKSQIRSSLENLK